MKLLYAAKRSVAAVLVPMLLASAVCAADVTVETDPSSGMKYRAILTERESQTDITLHESTYSPYFDLPSPSIFSEYTDEPRQICEGDIYVSTDGDDSGSGTAESPFLTIERARDEIRRRRDFGTLPDGGVTVSVRAGTYHMKSGIRFDSGDGGSADCPVTYTAYGDGEVILSGALELSASDFYKPSDGVASRFCDETSRHVLAADLKKYGVTSDMLSLNQTGQATMRGTNVELSVDRETYTLARYPNDSFLFSDGIVSKSGRARLIMTDDAVDRVSSWANTDNVWALGIINTDYNDSTSVVSIDTASRVLTFNNADTNGYKQKMPYYFFNVPEELDAPGEWYLDRDECVLYMYPNGDITDSSIELALGFNDTIVSFDGCRYITFDGFTLTGTRGSGLHASNVSDFTLSNCRFYNIGRNAVDGTGERCTVSECEVSYVGGSGISWSGGDKATLRRADNLIDNNLVTHWGLNTRTFTSAISGGGQGITISHNEMAYSTSNATGMTGNMNVLEYNLIHDCTRYASDCGAYYNGSSWTSGGCDIRYNCFYNIGSDMATPAAIFWDDGMAYQRAYKNLLLNISGYGISIGGGFGNAVVNNAIINTGKAPYLYDARPYNGNRQGDRFYAQDSSGFIWNLYKSTPYTTTVWRESFPLLAQVLQTSNDKIAPHFGFNPAFSLFTDNIFINRESLNGGVGVQHINYSTDIDNYVSDASVLADIFVDPEHGDYRLRDDSAAWSEVRDFEDIPYWKIGRY